MRHLSIVLFLFFSFAAGAQYSAQEYIRKYQMLAIEEMGRSGIPASIKMAQALLESGNGNSQLALRSNNHFGIKCKSHWRGQKVYHDDDEKNECFRKYASVEESYVDHSNFLRQNARYAFLFSLPPDDYKSWAHGLKAAGYATARHYDRALIKIIEDNKLYQLDQKQVIRPLQAYQDRPSLGTGMTDRITINPFNARDIIKVNDLRAVVARNGDTYEILAQTLGMEAWELYKFNDQRGGYRPQPNEVVYIEAKKNKPARNHKVHQASPGETMHFISQIYGIRLNPLMRRNRMKAADPVQPGQIIYLRTKKPR